MLFCRLRFERKYFSYFTFMKLVWLRQAKSCSAVYTSTLKCQRWYFSVTSLFLLRNALKNVRNINLFSSSPACAESVSVRRNTVQPSCLLGGMCSRGHCPRLSAGTSLFLTGALRCMLVCPQSLAVVAEWIKHLYAELPCELCMSQALTLVMASAHLELQGFCWLSILCRVLGGLCVVFQLNFEMSLINTAVTWHIC